MAKTPPEWIQVVLSACCREGLSLPDAEDCVYEVLRRYQRRCGSYPWDDPKPNVALVLRLSKDVACEMMRSCIRRERLERDFCLIRQVVSFLEVSAEAYAIADLEVERFHTTLPTYLRRALELLEQGYTADEIAVKLQVSPKTVYAYRAELKIRFIEYFGYDPRKSRERVGISDEAQTSSHEANTKEGHDEPEETAAGKPKLP